MEFMDSWKYVVTFANPTNNNKRVVWVNVENPEIYMVYKYGFEEQEPFNVFTIKFWIGSELSNLTQWWNTNKEIEMEHYKMHSILENIEFYMGLILMHSI